MKNLSVVLGCAIVTGVLFSNASAGPLSPPAGPVTSTGPTVIGALPFTVSQPGTYVLQSNLTGVASNHGVIISSSDVTIDLNGFSLIGVPGSLDGIRSSSSLYVNIEIRNGVVRNWGNDGIDLGNSENSTVRSIRASDNGFDGIRVRSGVLQDCVARNNLADGLEGIQNVAMFSCTAQENAFRGITVGVNATMTNCTALLNGTVGIQTGSASGILGCSSQQNGGDGFDIGFSSSITNSASRANDGDGIESGDGGVIIGCAVDLNDLHGIRVNTDALVQNNSCTGNGAGTGVIDGAGIYANSSDNRIEGNNCVDNDRGITVAIGGCFIVKNSASGNSINFNIAPGNNVVGPFISGAGTITTTNPWANFSY